MIKKHLDEGTLVPTDVTMELIKDKVLRTTNGVLLLDGYPRNMSNYNVLFLVTDSTTDLGQRNGI